MKTKLSIVLKKMCEFAGVNYDEVDFSKECWYEDYCWSEAKQENFRIWLNHELVENVNLRDSIMERPTRNPKIIAKFVDWFILDYGWRVK